MNISLIVIGKNEEKNLSSCFDSISKITQKYLAINFECIFIDSDSQDESVKIATEHPSVDKVIKLTGEVNSAIARNVGVFYSKGDILFFVDGDMELVPDFLEKAFDFEKGKLIHPVVTGDIINITDGQQSPYYGTKLRKDKFHKTTGGIFIIERKLWVKYNGMDVRFKRSQDLDFFYSLSCDGIKVLRKKELICYHHTFSYHSKERIVNALKSMYSLYAGLFYRKHLFKANSIIFTLLRKDYTAVLLFFSFLIPFFCSDDIAFLAALFYFVAILFRNFLSEKRINLYYVLYRIISDLYVMLGFIFFYPGRNKRFELTILKK